MAVTRAKLAVSLHNTAIDMMREHDHKASSAA